MSLTITKQKTKAKSPAKIAPPQVTDHTYIDPAELDLEELADLYGDLQDKVAALMLNPLFTQLEEATKDLKARLAEYGPLELVTIKGKRWMVEAGACSKVPRTITNIPKVAQLLGPATFAKIAKVGVGDAEKYLTPEQLAQVVWPAADTPEDEQYSKNRKITAKHIA